MECKSKLKSPKFLSVTQKPPYIRNTSIFNGVIYEIKSLVSMPESGLRVVRLEGDILLEIGVT